MLAWPLGLGARWRQRFEVTRVLIRPTSLVLGRGASLFIDRFLIDRFTGEARQKLHHPIPQEIVLVHDAPWEGTGSGYHSVFRDGDRYRMYYKAWHLQPTPGKLKSDAHPLFCCYAESQDGLHWQKPDLGLYEYDGSTHNNIVMTSGPLGSLQVDAGHPAVFLDENPDVPAEARFKAIFRSSQPNGLLPFKSADGLRWSPLTDKPVLSGMGAFDSQNLAFWDPSIKAYRAYWRYFVDGRRAIRTATSSDLVNWNPYTDLDYEDSPPEQLYTNQVKPYARAPHLLIGLPSRYVEREWSESMRQLPEREHRELRSSSVQRYGTATTEALLMCSRDGVHFKRWNEAFLHPVVSVPELGTTDTSTWLGRSSRRLRRWTRRCPNCRFTRRKVIGQANRVPCDATHCDLTVSCRSRPLGRVVRS